MAQNIAKRFANMTLVYWAPIHGGGTVRYAAPVAFKGKYINNAQLNGDGGPGTFVAASGSTRDNMVLFYMLRPEVEGYVSWDTTLNALTTEGAIGMHPSDIRGTHKIKFVNEYVMPRAKTATLANMAFIAQVV